MTLVLRSLRRSLSHKKAWKRTENRGGRVPEAPTTWSRRLIPRAMLSFPPNVPKSMISPARAKKFPARAKKEKNNLVGASSQSEASADADVSRTRSKTSLAATFRQCQAIVS